jgi:hypothetical protein
MDGFHVGVIESHPLPKYADKCDILTAITLENSHVSNHNNQLIDIGHELLGSMHMPSYQGGLGTKYDDSLSGNGQCSKHPSQDLCTDTPEMKKGIADVDACRYQSQAIQNLQEARQRMNRGIRPMSMSRKLEAAKEIQVDSIQVARTIHCETASSM